MSSEPTPKEPRKKDAEYMRKAYIYSAILLVLGLIGGLLLAERIITAEANQQSAQVEQADDEETPSGSQGGTEGNEH